MGKINTAQKSFIPLYDNWGAEMSEWPQKPLHR